LLYGGGTGVGSAVVLTDVTVETEPTDDEEAGAGRVGGVDKSMASTVLGGGVGA